MTPRALTRDALAYVAILRAVHARGGGHADVGREYGCSAHASRVRACWLRRRGVEIPRLRAGRRARIPPHPAPVDVSPT